MDVSTVHTATAQRAATALSTSKMTSSFVSILRYFTPYRSRFTNKDIELDIQHLQLTLSVISNQNLIDRQRTEEHKTTARRTMTELRSELETVEGMLTRRRIRYGHLKWIWRWEGLGSIEKSEVGLAVGVLDFKVSEFWKGLWDGRVGSRDGFGNNIGG